MIAMIIKGTVSERLDKIKREAAEKDLSEDPLSFLGACSGDETVS